MNMKTTTRTLTAITLATALGGGTLLAGAGHADHLGGGADGGRGIGLLASGLSGPVAAQAHASADTDGDGTLSQDEIRGLHARLLAAHDANGDGSLSLEEFEGLWLEATRTAAVRAFQSLDADGDATVTGAEYDRLLADVRNRRDSDGDDDDDGRWWNLD